MAKKKKEPIGEVRRSQVITTYGPGALIAAGDVSYIVKGIDYWDVDKPDLHEPRLERQLRVEGFASPPTDKDSEEHLPVGRFPTWYHCPECDRLNTHRWLSSDSRSNTCNNCVVPLVPSRFVIACKAGHIADFPFYRWVHHGIESSENEKLHDLSYYTSGATASLKSIIITCSCGASRNMDGAFSLESTQRIGPCPGKRPWLRVPDSRCSELARTLQRGASNVWFSKTRSALSIPPWSTDGHRILDRHWSILRVIPPNALKAVVKDFGFAEKSKYSVDDYVDLINQRRDGKEESGDGDLRSAEYEALNRGAADKAGNAEFVCVAGELRQSTRRWFDKVMLVKRLREVRALESFTRVYPGTSMTEPGDLAALASESPLWLPGIEVNGEGVFLRLEPARLEAWETQTAVKNRTEGLDRRYRNLFLDKKLTPDRVISPRLLLIHTLAHALINEWSMDSGYPAASLRERLYASPTMAGILIYTATTDSAGSLGGIVSLAQPRSLDQTLTRAIQRMAWCSSDPVCIEANSAGVDSLNISACHACTLLPENSCEERNILLDRATLCGTPNDPRIGFFSEETNGE